VGGFQTAAEEEKEEKWRDRVHWCTHKIPDEQATLRASEPAGNVESAEAGEGHAQAAGTVQAQPFRSVR